MTGTIELRLQMVILIAAAGGVALLTTITFDAKRPLRLHREVRVIIAEKSARSFGRKLARLVYVSAVTLIHPIAMDDGLRFAIREGGRTVGAGVVAKVLG